MEKIQLNKPYYTGSEEFFYIIREDHHSYYVIDSIDLELNRKGIIPIFETEKNYDAEFMLEKFLLEQGIRL